MKKYIKYFKYVFTHKYWVMVMCFDMWLYWQWIIHDWSKFLPNEYIPYTRWRGKWDKSNESELSYNKSWLKHINRNPHHWNHRVMFNDDWTTNCIEMPEKYVKEMLCDWRWVGRSFAHTDEEITRYKNFPRHEVYTRYSKRKDNMTLHINTRKYIEIFLDMKKHLEYVYSSIEWWGFEFKKAYWDLYNKTLWQN